MPEAAIAPAPAPAAPAPLPPSQTGKSSGPNMDVVFSGFDALVAPEPAPEPKPATTDPAAAADPVAPKGDAGKDPQTPDPKPAADPKAPVVDPKTAPPKAATLREMATRAQSEAKEWQTKYEQLKAESAKPKADPEKDTLLKEREAWNKAKADLETELKFAKYERSQEFKDKYQTPFLNTYNQAKTLMPSLSFKDGDKVDAYGETQAGQMRKATEADWETLMAISDEDSANKFIADHFGHNAARVTVLRDRVLDMHSQMRNAVEDYRKQGETRETSLRENQAREQQAAKERWHTANTRAAEKYPQYFGADPADAKGNELLEHGARLTDLAFGALSPDQVAKLPQSIQAKMVNGQLPPEELTLLHSAVRNRSAAYDRLIYRLSQKEADLKAAQDKLKGFEESEPQRGQERKVAATAAKPGVPNSFADVDSAFDRLAAGNS